MRIKKEIREKILKKQNSRCLKCNLNEWLGEDLILELDHIDGNNKNNKENNLRYLCPNCHSQTITWRGRKRNTGKKIISDKDFIKILKEEKNIYRTLKKAGYTPKGANYAKAYKIINEHNLHYLFDEDIKEKCLIKHNKEKEKRHNKELKIQKIEIIKHNLMKSDIDFSKFGWVEKASNIIGITAQKVNQWMKKNMSEFYEKECFKRKIAS